MAKSKSLQKQIEQSLLPLAIELLRQQLSGEKCHNEASVRAAVNVLNSVKEQKTEEKKQKKEYIINFGNVISAEDENQDIPDDSTTADTGLSSGS